MEMRSIGVDSSTALAARLLVVIAVHFGKPTSMG
jgi:hypothetical protein